MQKNPIAYYFELGWFHWEFPAWNGIMWKYLYVTNFNAMSLITTYFLHALDEFLVMYV